jgi:hypothetical protein
MFRIAMSFRVVLVASILMLVGCNTTPTNTQQSQIEQSFHQYQGLQIAMFQAAKVGCQDGTIATPDAYYQYINSHTTQNLATAFGVEGQQIGAMIPQAPNPWVPASAMNACDLGVAIWSGQTAAPQQLPPPVPINPAPQRN